MLRMTIQLAVIGALYAFHSVMLPMGNSCGGGSLFSTDNRPRSRAHHCGLCTCGSLVAMVAIGATSRPATLLAVNCPWLRHLICIPSLCHDALPDAPRADAVR